MINKFSVNVISVRKAREHLSTMLTRFRSGSTDPLIFGEGGKPEAVIIAFEDYKRYLKYEAAADAQENGFQNLVAGRLASEKSEPAGDLNAFAATLGEAGRKWVEDTTKGGQA